MKPIRLIIAGDSTAAAYPKERSPMAGWGQMVGDISHRFRRCRQRSPQWAKLQKLYRRRAFKPNHGCDAGRRLPADPIRP